ncbi:unnamed protein product [Sphagnum jensenii]|uniref:BFN domain-containing protein n=2 Tax=Sphagnum jensenii TaxID=128206 RepID=A0ABP1AWL6_9BRYO
METLHLLQPQSRLCKVLSSPLSIRAGAGGGGALKLADHQHHPLRLKQGVLEWGSMKKQAQEERMAKGWGRGGGWVCRSYESSNGGGSSHVEDDSNSSGTMEYLEAQVMDAMSMVPLHGKLLMMLANGREQEVDHINPSKGRLLYKTSTPTIFLKVKDGSDLMLPIVVGEGAVSMLMKALHDEEHFGRPSCYHIMKEMLEALNYKAKMVRITERVVDTYYARILFGKKGAEQQQEEDDEEEALLSVDARPSDAINFAVRCKVPIFINKSIIRADAVRPVLVEEESGGRAVISKRFKLKGAATASFCSKEVASKGDSFAADEAAIVMSMLIAATEERYADAAHWRDELVKLRIIRKEKMRPF